MPVTDLKSGSPRQRKPAANGSRSCKSHTLQNLVPTGWAPGPAGEGMPFKLPPLKITLPKEYTVPLAHMHYEEVRNQLRQRIRAGGQDGVTVIINGRLTSQEPGRIKPCIINCETIADVPIRIDYDNLQRLLFNTFLSGWLKRFMNYPLNLDHVALVQLIKGRVHGGIYLDNKDHAILEHCLGPDGNKLTVKALDVMLLIDPDHYEEAKAHWDSVNGQLGDQETSDHQPDSEAIFVSRTAEPGLTTVPKSQATPSQVKTRPKPRAIFGKKRKTSEDPQNTIRVQKRTRSGNTSGPSHTAAPVEDIHQALIAQHEPRSNDINGLQKKEAFLVEELIQSTDGPWRKYINNDSSHPHYFGGHENRQRAEFLAFCQHVQYWRTGCQAFTSNFQGGDTLLTD
ncbi:hypothetical protein V8E53_011927, partial [Lactarius tabidus]